MKLSGDGARFSSQASYIFLTFSFPGLATDVLSASGMHKCNVKCPYTYIHVLFLKEITHMLLQKVLRATISCSSAFSQCGMRSER